MRATPRIAADFDEYPELRVLADAAIRRVVELMEIHDIAEIRRIHKLGVFDRPYSKDVIREIGLPTPGTVSSVRYAVGKVLLDYLETIGIQGISLELTKEDAAAISTLWSPRRNPQQEKKDPEPVKVKDGAGEGEPPEKKPCNPEKEERKPTKQKESKNGK